MGPTTYRKRKGDAVYLIYNMVAASLLTQIDIGPRDIYSSGGHQTIYNTNKDWMKDRGLEVGSILRSDHLILSITLTSTLLHD